MANIQYLSKLFLGVELFGKMNEGDNAEVIFIFVNAIRIKRHEVKPK
jgi:hypothetical protein